ncbi:PA2928 family protein [Glycomyces harbinensis]|uniref:Uncharacterized protein n=1 Tax=Glycomyces harbinensis TaxID=58114 RepID=A0A1G7B3A4_9ACTN|nr:PA2928 family protein [Glycomyces harbinensis]SDE21400.1 hypothetical protein SAMN05216270_115117 [Glycomyces harbinensis]
MYYDPPRSPLPAHGQQVRSPYGTPEQPLTPATSSFKSPVRGMLAMLLLSSLGIGAIAILGEHLTAPDPQITLQSGIGFAADDEGELVLVPYERAGSGGLIASASHDMFQVRIAAVDLATGEARWDVQLTDEIGWGAAVVAAGETYAYLATDDGLRVLELDDGSTAAEPGAITGLAGAAASGAAYAFDPALGAVVALDVNGGVHTIALDTLEAAPAGEDTAATWSGLLAAEGNVPDIGGLTTTEALLADGESTVRVKPTAEGALGATLEVDDGDGLRDLGTRVFYGAQIVLDQTALASTTATLEVDVEDLIEGFMEDPEAAGADLWTGLGNTAAGAASGHVLVEHQIEPNGDAYALNVISLDTGQVTASMDTATNLGRAATSPGGYTTVITAPADDPWHSDLVVVAPDGSIDRLEFAATDFFGDPDY